MRPASITGWMADGLSLKSAESRKVTRRPLKSDDPKKRGNFETGRSFRQDFPDTFSLSILGRRNQHSATMGITMSNDPSNELKIQRLKMAKSAYILEADSLLARGLESAGMALFVEAAQLEMELADLFRAQGEEQNSQVSLRSAGFCYSRARQYRHAGEVLRQVAEQFADVREWIDRNKDKGNVPLAAATPGLQALIDLLVTKGVIQENEWIAAMAPH